MLRVLAIAEAGDTVTADHLLQMASLAAEHKPTVLGIPGQVPIPYQLECTVVLLQSLHALFQLLTSGHSTFAHCVALNCIWLPPRLTQIGKEVFLNCVALQEVVIPTELCDIGIRAFCGCEQLQRFTPLDWGEIEQSVQAEHNAFLMCDKFERPLWVELLPAEGPDSDAFDEELYNELS